MSFRPARTPRRKLLRGPVQLACALLLAACSPAGAGRAATCVAELRTNLLRAGRVDVLVEAGDLEDACRRAAARRSRARDGWSMEVVHRSRSDRRAARVLVGTPEDPYLRQLALRAGCVALGKRRFSFAERVFEAPGDLFVACFEDPERPGLPLALYLGNDARALATQLDSLGTSWVPHARVLRGGEAVLEADLALDGRPRGAPRRGAGAERARRLAQAERHELPGSGLELRASAYDEAFPAPRLRSYAEACAEARARLLRWAGAELEPPYVSVALWSSADELRDLPPQGGLSSAPSAAGGALVHALLAPGLADDAGAAAARASAILVLGAPLDPWLADAAAFEAADRWWGRGLESWVAWLAAGGLLPPLDELLDARACERRSPHLVSPARAALLRMLLEERGAAFVRELWVGARPALRAAELERDFAAWVAARVARHAEGHAGWRGARRAELARLAQPGSWSGFALEASLLEGATALGSRRAAATLDEAAARGARALGITSFLVAGRAPLERLGADRAPVFGPVEGDAALAGAIGRARRLGLSTLIVPEVLAGTGGTKAGDLLRGIEEHWTEFFDEQGRALVHFALVAELARAEALALGASISAAVELGPSGWRAGPEEEGWKRAGWEEVLARVRGAYAGLLTYVTGWPGALRQVSLWPELDLVALELFPLAPSELADPRALEQLASRLAQALDAAQHFAAASKKPVLVARYGLPGELAGGREGELQREGLALLEEALAERASLAGVMLWRLGLDPLERPLGASDPLLRASVREEAFALIGRLGGPR